MSHITNISVGPFSLKCLQPGVRPERGWCQDLEEAEQEKGKPTEIEPKSCYPLIDAEKSYREETWRLIDGTLNNLPSELIKICFSYYFTPATFCMISQGERTFCHVGSNHFQIPQFGSQFWRPSHPLPVRAYVVLVPDGAKTLIWNQSRSSEVAPEKRGLNWSVSTSQWEQYAEGAFQPNRSELDRVDEQIASMKAGTVFVAVHPLIRPAPESPTMTRIGGEWLSDNSSDSEGDLSASEISSSPLSSSSLLIENGGSVTEMSTSSSESTSSMSDEKDFAVVALTVLPILNGKRPSQVEIANLYLSLICG